MRLYWTPWGTFTLLSGVETQRFCRKFVSVLWKSKFSFLSQNYYLWLGSLCWHTCTAFSMQTYSNLYLDTSWEGHPYFFSRDLTGCRGFKNYMSVVKNKFLWLYLKITLHEHFCSDWRRPCLIFQRNYIGFMKTF